MNEILSKPVFFRSAYLTVSPVDCPDNFCMLKRNISSYWTYIDGRRVGQLVTHIDPVSSVLWVWSSVSVHVCASVVSVALFPARPALALGPANRRQRHIPRSARRNRCRAELGRTALRENARAWQLKTAAQIRWCILHCSKFVDRLRVRCGRFESR